MIRIIAFLLMMSTAYAAGPTQPVVRFNGNSNTALYGDNVWRAPTVTSTTTSIYAGSGVSLDGGPTGNVTVNAAGTVSGATAPLTISSGNVSLTYDPATISVTDSKLSIKQIVTGGTFGNTTSIPVLTVDNYGRVTALSAVTASTTDSLATTTYAGISRLSWPPVNSVDPISCSDTDPRLPRYLTAPATENNQVFAYTGANQSWTVPAGVYTITIKAWGAGGSGTSAAGGGGGYAFDRLTVVPGQTVTVKVGRGGQSYSWDGALYGEGGHSTDGGGGGGYAMATNGTWEIYAGGGGGGGTAWGYGQTAGGAGGGLSGVAGGGSGGGGPGTQTAVGAGGTGDSTGNPGVAHHGGNAPVGQVQGVGAGGGGYYGGGSGGLNQGVRHGGGGGSGRIVTGLGVTTAGSGQTPGNASDPDRAGMGDGGGAGAAGDHGIVKITWTPSSAVSSLTIPSLIFLGPTAPTTTGQISFDGSRLMGYDAGSSFPLRASGNVSITGSGNIYVNGVQTQQVASTFTVTSSAPASSGLISSITADETISGTGIAWFSSAVSTIPANTLAVGDVVIVDYALGTVSVNINDSAINIAGTRSSTLGVPSLTASYTLIMTCRAIGASGSLQYSARHNASGPAARGLVTVNTTAGINLTLDVYVYDTNPGSCVVLQRSLRIFPIQ